MDNAATGQYFHQWLPPASDEQHGFFAGTIYSDMTNKLHYTAYCYVSSFNACSSLSFTHNSLKLRKWIFESNLTLTVDSVISVTLNSDISDKQDNILNKLSPIRTLYSSKYGIL